MNISHGTPASPEACPPDPRSALEKELEAEHIAALRKLTRLSMALAEAVQECALDRLAQEKADGTPRGDLTAAFARTANSARLAMALTAKLAAAHRIPAPKPASDQAAKPNAAARKAEAERVKWRRAQIDEAVKTAIQYGVPFPVTGEDFDRVANREAWEQRDLAGAMLDRLEAEDFGADFGDRPISEIVAGLCQEIRVTPNWRWWAKDPWAIEEAKTKPPGSPYADWPPAAREPP